MRERPAGLLSFAGSATGLLLDDGFEQLPVQPRLALADVADAVGQSSDVEAADAAVEAFRPAAVKPGDGLRRLVGVDAELVPLDQRREDFGDGQWLTVL